MIGAARLLQGGGDYELTEPGHSLNRSTFEKRGLKPMATAFDDVELSEFAGLSFTGIVEGPADFATTSQEVLRRELLSQADGS
ncbi:hypothetical protein ACIBCN_13715 [Nocardia sp. NPDC051052]|uniref:hypothetical protein n=1 Tax=Nocardia sp. NPDC051052 TaxID=3364322 RepID=UPI0037BAE6A9